MKRIIALQLVLVFLAASCLAAIEPAVSTTNNYVEDSWVTKASMPTARAFFGVAVVNGKIYAIGGTGGVNEVYDPASDTWATKKPMPTPRRTFAIAVFQNKIYCIGGKASDGLSGANEVYDPTTDTWEAKTSLPTPRSQLSASVLGGKIYVIGGFSNLNTGEISNLNEVYDPATDTWIAGEPIPDPVYSHSSVSVDNRIFVISSLFQIYEPATENWVSGVSPPNPSHRSGAVVTSGEKAPKRIYVIGGEVGFMDATKINQIYDLQENTWSTAASMPTARQGLGVAVVEDLIYAIGGSYPEWYNTETTSAETKEKFALLSNHNVETFNFVPQKICALNDQYTPIGYGKTEPSPSPSPPPSPSPSPTPSQDASSASTLQQSESLPTTLVTATVVTVTVFGFGFLLNLAKKKRSGER